MPGRRADDKDWFATWHILGILKMWIGLGQIQVVYNLKREQRQALLGGVALAADETVNTL